MSFTDRRAWLNNSKLSNIESRKISSDIQSLAARLAEESRKRRQIKIESEKMERRKALSSNPNSRPSSARVQEIRKLNLNQYALAAEMEQRSLIKGKLKPKEMIENDNLLSPQINPSNPYSSIFLINEVSLEVQNNQSSRNSTTSIKKLIPLVEEVANSQSGNRIPASEFGIIDLSPLGIEFSQSFQSLDEKSNQSSPTSEQLRPNRNHDTKSYVADSNGKPYEWTLKDPVTLCEPRTFMDLSQRPMSARKGCKEKDHLSDSLPQYPDLTVQIVINEEANHHHSSEKSDNRKLFRQKSVFRNANPLIAKNRMDEEALNEERRKTSAGVRRLSSSGLFQSTLVKDMRSFTGLSNSSLYDDATPRISTRDVSLSIEVEDLS